MPIPHLKKELMLLGELVSFLPNSDAWPFGKDQRDIPLQIDPDMSTPVLAPHHLSA